MNRIFYRLGQLMYRFRYWVIGFWLVGLIASLPVIPHIMDPFQSSGFENIHSQSFDTNKLLENSVGYQKHRILVLFTKESDTVSNQMMNSEVNKALKKLDHVSYEHKVLFQINKDSTLAVIAFRDNLELNSEDIKQLKKLIKKPKHLQVYFGGEEVFVESVNKQTEKDLFRADMIAAPVSILTLLFVFGSVVAALMPMLLGGCCALMNQRPGYERSIWYLDLPHETQVYVPRLLALAEIIAHPEKYHVTLPYVIHEPFFKEVHIDGQIDLNQAAKLAGVNYQELLKLNPGFNHWATSPNHPKLLIPVKNAEQFSRNLANTPINIRSSFEHYLVKSGDTLSSIAYRYHTQLQLLAKINHLENMKLKPGMLLNIPSLKPQLMPVQKTIHSVQAINPKQYKILHIVQAHETLETISHKYQINSADIRSWNHLSSNDLSPGQKLMIWRQTNGNSFYVVKQGDSFNHIAQVHHISSMYLSRLNPNVLPRQIKPGMKLKIC